MAMTDGAITPDEALASALDAIDTSQGAAGARVGCVKSSQHVLRVDFSERHSALLDLAQVAGDFDVRLERLAVGDYVVGAGVLVERKTYADFAMSLVDDSAWLFWDDSGAGPDDNHDDMLIRAVFTPATSVPEPGTLALFGMGMLAAAFARRRARR